jgi:polyhydroxyalkanoate synthesis repressor PhaR
MSPEALKPEPKVIKRYTNRKLYDTLESRYVTLDEIAAMVKQGVEVKIVDNRTKEDLTSVTLAQIVFEEEKKKNTMPLSVLRGIIRNPQESLSELTSTVSQRVAEIREEAGQRLSTFLSPRPSAPQPPPPSEQAPPPPPAGILQQSQKVVEAWQHRIDERVKTALESWLGNLPALGRDITALVQRLEQLEQKIAALEEQKKKDR